jgi:TPR repeat protein
VYLRQAAEAGHLAGMGLLGYLLVRAQRMDEAEQWLGAAAAAGHVASMLNLSNVLKLGGRPDESRRWADRWRAAVAEEGINPGMQLSVHLLPATAGTPSKSGRVRTKRRGAR